MPLSLSSLWGSWLILSLSALALHAAEPLRIITIGDSITRGVRPDVTADQTFAALVKKALIEQGIPTELTNAGIGGDTVDALKRLQAGVLAQKPHLVTLMYGTNDSYVPKSQTKSRNTLTDYETSLRKMIAALKAAGIQPILMTSPPWAEGAPPDGLGQHPNLQLIPYIERCRAVAQELQIPLVDHHAHWMQAAEQGQKLKAWTSDFCHPNARGHEEMAGLIMKTLLPIAKGIAHP